MYTVGEANPDSLSTMHSTKRVRISLFHCSVEKSVNLNSELIKVIEQTSAGISNSKL